MHTVFVYVTLVYYLKCVVLYVLFFTENHSGGKNDGQLFKLGSPPKIRFQTITVQAFMAVIKFNILQ